MDDVIALEATLGDGARRFFVTWGRIQDPVDPEAVCRLVAEFAHTCVLGGELASIRLCNSLRDAADSHDAPYFFECFARFSREPIPFGADYESWRDRRNQAMAAGREIAYCGSPSRIQRPSEP